MIIKKLTLCNFGVYAGSNTFEFSGKKPIVLIGGLNGRGKTTFLEAVLLSLYGSKSFAYEESAYSTYGQYLRSFVNRNEPSDNTYVEIEFRLSADEKDTYLVHREWNGNGQRTREMISVYQNGKYSEFLTENWPMFIENILPSALSNFFFFDGEKIAELAVDDTDEKMRESIRSMLGLTVLDRLNNDMNRIVSRISKQKLKKEDTEQLDGLRVRKEEAENRVIDLENKIKDTEHTIADINATLEQKRIEYTAIGGDVIAQQQSLFEKKAVLNHSLKETEEDLIAVAGSELPFALVSDLLEKIIVQVGKENEQKKAKDAVAMIDALFNDYAALEQSEQVAGFVDFIRNNAEINSVDTVFDYSDASRLQLDYLLKKGLSETLAQADLLMGQKNELRSQLDNIDSYLSVDINEEEIKKVYREIKTLEQDAIEAQVVLESLKERLASAQFDCKKVTSEYHRMAETALEKLEANDNAERLIRYGRMSQTILKEYSIRLQKNKVDTLATTVTSCYQQLANKKTLIDHIEIDPTSLELRYVNSENEDVPKNKLSAGEKQLMVISILWALAKCSKKKLPVIIDTPLSRLDSAHRTSLVTVYFPNASEQTIILSTDTEIDDTYYHMMEENVGDEFRLNYDEKTRSTTITSGYLNEVQHDC